MQTISVIYVMYVPPGQTRLLLDGMRLFANPHAKHTAHVSVRGPYPDYQDPRAWSARAKGQNVSLGPVGTFFGPKQNTVFLEAQSEAILALWHKPSYADSYNPHLTVYDGESRTFAEAIRDALAERPVVAGFIAAGVEPLVLRNGPRPLRATYEPAAFAGVMDRPPTLEELDSAGESLRVSWIVELAESLAHEALQTAKAI